MALFSFGFPSNKSFSPFGQYVEKDSAQSGTSHDACKVLGGHCCCRRLIKSLCLFFEATPFFGGFKGNHGNPKGQVPSCGDQMSCLQYFSTSSWVAILDSYSLVSFRVRSKSIRVLLFAEFAMSDIARELKHQAIA